jgi:hypothetical protein
MYEADGRKSIAGRIVPVKELRDERFRELDRLIAEQAVYTGPRRCAGPGCERQAEADGLCKRCWMRRKRARRA